MVLEDILEVEHPGLGMNVLCWGLVGGRQSRRSSRYSPNYCKPGKGADRSAYKEKDKCSISRAKEIQGKYCW